VTEPSGAEVLAGLLRQISGGKIEAQLDGTAIASIDGESRTVTVHLDPLLAGDRPSLPRLHEGHLKLWSARGVPSSLARSGWHVSLQSGEQELVGLGRGVSALTGHVRVSPSALWKLRRLL
jgi:hypothetical protein